MTDYIRCPSCELQTVPARDGVGTCDYCGRQVDAELMKFAMDAVRAERKPEPSNLPPVVYYLAWADRIKIGTSANIRQRLGSIYHDELLALEPGGPDLEKVRHQQFAAARLPRYREWFTATPELIAHTEAIRERHRSLLGAV